MSISNETMLAIDPMDHVLAIEAGVRILDGQLLDKLDEANEHDPYSSEGAAQFKAWCEKYRVHFYCKPREGFSRIEGLAEANRKGSMFVLMEDLS